jgi:hypothetical protein
VEFNQITHPLLVAVWARFDAPAENIQYVSQGDEGNFEQIADQSLFVDYDAEGKFTHFYSLGKQLPGTEDLDEGYRIENPRLRYRYQQAIELVPIMGDEQFLKPAIVMTHGLRSGPHFTISNLTAPYPIHLANAMVYDLVCLLGVKPED